MTKTSEIRDAVRACASPARALVLQRFFKTGPGEYGEGDRFLGLTVPQVRALARRFHPADFAVIPSLVRSPYHEERLLGLLLLVERYRRGSESDRRAAYRLYLRSFPRINNWDLVDVTAEHIVGAHGVGRAQLLSWAASGNLWVRRIAIISTFHAIRRNRFDDTLAVAKCLLRDEEDLLHKAAGWMLREVGKRDVAALESFLRRHHRSMPRTMLRYAIERFPEPRRKAWLKGEVR
jgi:3-methyladenine DNA glycosylase AlkD